ncbi:DUF1758 domain-containing protein [Trichonephila inaurata madagascariensis]|uniref:DUF1758 domain-containing protein n=1 Tax=Trichonephila inaurata madagascariensis TaxID=2747483 RepID=A0A8X7C1P7_9ARAC|nr:DUF1758 domain-containing protein [Trichonephila inaurata madagascariensis]
MGKDIKINQAKSLSTVNEQQKPRSSMSMLSNQISSLDIKELWSLETIGIRDPVENLKGKELNSEYIKRFENELDILPDGRHQLKLPFKIENSLTSNKKHDLEKTLKKCVKTRTDICYKTTKIRPVYDATARESGKPSFNDVLHKGPGLIELIPDILDRFRSYPISLSAGIEKAFLQLAIALEHTRILKIFLPF